MRIALLAHAPALGGSTDLLIQARDYFLSRGHSVQCVFGMSAAPSDNRTSGAWIIPVSPEGWRARMREYRRRVESFHPDIVYAISGKDEMDLLRFLSCVRVRHISSLEQHEFYDVPFTLKKGSRFVEAYSANTPDALEEVERISGKPAFLLPYLLPEPLHQIKEIDSSRLLDENNPIEIAFVSRLERFQKRTHWLPEIIRICEKAGSHFRWHLYGDGSDLAFLQSQLENNSLVIFHGWVDRKALYEKLPHHDIIFFCSRWEGLPIAMVEGMRCGLACVSTDIPAGIRWTLQQGGGWLYKARSPADAATALLNATNDRNVLLQRREEALRLAKKLFSSQVSQNQYGQLEDALTRLRFNGNVLKLENTGRFHGISLATYLKRLVVPPKC